MGEPTAAFAEPNTINKPPPPDVSIPKAVPKGPPPQPLSESQVKALYASHGIKPSPASSSAEKYKAPPPCNYTAPPAYSREAYRSPLSATPILMVAITKPAAKALPSNFTRPPTPPVPDTLPQTVPKPPPPPVPIGPALPEGQAPPYAVQQVEKPSAVPPR